MSRETDYLGARIERLEKQLRDAQEQVGYWREAARLAEERAKKAERTAA